ncbi:MAG: CHC2 zinc finger domain-containing protein, partial [Prosthecobacter sp.]|uniref:CHC2 zinc finger domain-containing protein n=1 Tax=Prosthecobacter sp. TaxID=1965333 RepID=UPI003BB213AF
MTTRPPNHHDIPALKERLLIPEVWRKLGLEGQPAQTCRSPFREDKPPSFSISKDGKRWKDYGTGQNGDVIDFIAMARQISTGEALRVFLELAGVSPSRPGHAPHAGSPR